MVEWKKLGDFALVQKTKNKKHITENAYSITQAGLIPTKSFFKEKTNVTSKDTSGYYIVEKDWFVYSPSRIDVGSISYLKDEGPVIVSPIDVVFSIDKSICMPDYLLSYFFTYNGRKDLLRNIEGVEGMGRRNLPFDAIKNMQIPIPSLSEQNRIVSTLDTFTSSIENLKEQIAQRRKQYEYYRDQLLDLEGKEGVEMKTCGEFCEVTDYVANGSFATLRENVTYKQEPDYAVLVRTVDLSRGFEGDKIFIDEKAYKFLSKSSLFGGEIIINNIGAGVGQTFRCPYLKERMSLAPNSIMVKTPNNDYFFYWFNSIYGQNAMMKIVTPGAMPKFNKTGFKTILVPIPSLQEQNRIVSILDTFEASIQNLEAQLKEREKQYEYYRNKLLTFE